MDNIDKHKVFISFKYSENSQYKDKLVKLNEDFNIFDDYSVGEGEIDDSNLDSEQIRTQIRDGWIQGASVLILLNGQSMRDSKFIDWEIHAAMTDYENSDNKKMGILVINLPEINETRFNSSGHVKRITEENGILLNWVPAGDYETLLRERPNTPKRLIKNLAKSDVKIDVINWDDLTYRNAEIMATRIKKLVDIAFQNRIDNIYDVSDKLQGRK